MPYNNPYNRGIANEIHTINERFAHLYAYSPVDGRGNSYAMDGGSSAGVLYQMGNASKRDAEDNVVNDNLELPPVYYYGNSAEEMQGGNGFAQGTFRDRGDGQQLGVASGSYVKGSGMSGGDIVDRLMKKKNMSKSEAVKYAQEQGYYDNPAERSQRTADAQAKAEADYQASHPKQPTFWEQVGSTLEDIAPTVAELAVHALGAGKHDKGREMGQALQHIMSKGDLKGGSFWDDLGSTLLHLAPALLGVGKKKPGRPKKVGGAILGNPDPYPVQGDSQRLAGRGRGRPKKQLVGDNGDLLAMPNSILANGVPPTAQLQGSYGGSKPSNGVSAEDKEAFKIRHGAEMARQAQVKALKDKMFEITKKHAEDKKNLAGMTDKRKTGGKNLSGMTDKRGGGAITKQEKDALQSVIDKHGDDPYAQPVAPAVKGKKVKASKATTHPKAIRAPTQGTPVPGAKKPAKKPASGKRQARAELVKKIMKERGVKMIEASSIVKREGLTY